MSDTEPGGRMAKARERELRYLMSFNMRKVNRYMFGLLVVYLALNFADTITTLEAMTSGPSFVELNPIAATLFAMNFWGFVAALAIKYAPAVPLAYITFMRGGKEGAVHYRMIKIAGLVALGASVLFLTFVVGSNAIMLARFYGYV